MALNQVHSRFLFDYGGIYREEIKGAGFLFDYGKLHG
jgi:hypothetical protein